MIYVIPAHTTHVAILTIQFREGEPEESMVAAGTFEECDKFASMFPAVSRSGDREAASASISVYPYNTEGDQP